MHALKASMDEIFKARLLHFGMLNVENIENYDTLKGTDLKYLKVAFCVEERNCLHFTASDFPGLTMIVVKLHTENVDNGGDHWPVAPNPDGVDLTDHNALSLASIKEEVKKLLLDVARHGRYAMLSFAMYARTYRMKASWSKVSVRETSEASLNMDYAAVCKMKAEKDSSDHGTMYVADQQKKFLALFDSPSTFKAKASIKDEVKKQLLDIARHGRYAMLSFAMCGRTYRMKASWSEVSVRETSESSLNMDYAATKARLNVMPKNFTGLAVYNVEMDDSKDACGKERLPRLGAIKAALAARPPLKEDLEKESWKRSPGKG
ncbi:hypothetical protein V5799_007999 [Amblyomma americanum]|uniref:Uncharacterized protein n=1 Tax=Amblyomma americanum TaxID=6943 RepID=A0AAQ4FFB9_AMBAM